MAKGIESRPSFIEWARSKGGMYLHDKRKPTLATWQPHQVDILNHLFPAGDADAALPYSRIIWSDVKKSGKSELTAAVHLYYAWFVGDPGEQYILSNDLGGAKSRVLNAINDSLEKNPMIKVDEWKLVGTDIRLWGSGFIRAIPSDYRGEAGAIIKMASVDEVWGIIHTGGVRLMTEFIPTPTIPYSMILYTGYQGFIGESDWWHNLIDGVMEGEPVPELVHIDDGTGKPACWRNGRTFLYWNHDPLKYPWLTKEYLDEERRTMRAMPGEFDRVYSNSRVQSKEAFCTDEQWDRLEDTQLRGLQEKDDRLVFFGVDAATKKDCMAIVGCTWNAEKRRIDVVYCRVWEPEAGKPIQLTETIEPELILIPQNRRVVGAHYDPYQMASVAEKATKAGLKMIEFQQGGDRITSDGYLRDLIIGGNLAHYGDPRLREHVINAKAKSTERGVRIVKELANNKVDAAVALSMAVWGVKQYIVGSAPAEMETQENPFYG